MIDSTTSSEDPSFSGRVKAMDRAVTCRFGTVFTFLAARKLGQVQKIGHINVYGNACYTGYKSRLSQPLPSPNVQWRFNREVGNLLMAPYNAKSN